VSEKREREEGERAWVGERRAQPGSIYRKKRGRRRDTTEEETASHGAIDGHQWWLRNGEEIGREIGETAASFWRVRRDEGVVVTPGFKGQSRVHLIHVSKKITYIITECIKINVII
jgi:hypothetical protein